MFDQLIVSSAACARTRVSRTLPMAALLHATALAVIVSIPLMFPAAIPQEVGRFLTEVTNRYAPPIVVPAPPTTGPAGGPQTPRPPRPPVDLGGFHPPLVIPDDLPPPDDRSAQEYFPVGESGLGVPGGYGVPGRLVPGIDQAAWIHGNDIVPEAPPPPVRPAPPRDRKPVSATVLLSKLVRRVEPVYPEMAIRAGIQGVVIIQVAVDESGRVADVRVVSGNPILAAAARTAVEQWVYSPTSVDGRPISIIGTVSVNFTLNR